MSWRTMRVIVGHRTRQIVEHQALTCHRTARRSPAPIKSGVTKQGDASFLLSCTQSSSSENKMTHRTRSIRRGTSDTPSRGVMVNPQLRLKPFLAAASPGDLGIYHRQGAWVAECRTAIIGLWRNQSHMLSRRRRRTNSAETPRQDASNLARVEQGAHRPAE